MDKVLQKLEQILEQRKSADADKSYVAGLYKQGLEEILRKIDEESGELIDAAKNADEHEIIHELADLWFHTLILLRHKNIDLAKIETELSARFGISGLVEKANRGK